MSPARVDHPGGPGDGPGGELTAGAPTAGRGQATPGRAEHLRVDAEPARGAPQQGLVPDPDVDFGRTAGDYARHRAGFPPALLDRLHDRALGLPGQRVLDVGAGTGTLARALAARGAHVVALDPKRPLLEAGRRLAHEGGLRAGAPPRVDPARASLAWVVGVAEALPLAAGRFDLVTAGQCWHWFDRARAAAEARRVLRAGGGLAICHFDWLPRPGGVAAATEALVLAHNPAWRGAGGLGVHPQALEDLARAGFDDVEAFSFDVPVPYTHEAWRGRLRACAGVAATLAPEAVARFDDALAALLARDFPGPLAVPHRVFVALGRRGPGRA